MISPGIGGYGITMTTSSSHPDQRQRNIPTWVNALIVLAVLLIGLWAVWQFALNPARPIVLAPEEVTDTGPRRGAWSPPASRPFVAGSERRWPGGGGGGAGRNNPSGRDEPIRRTSSGGIRARHNDVLLSASYSQAKGVHDVDLNYSYDLMERWVSSREIQTHMLAWRASNITNTAKAIDLSDEQKQKLLALNYHMTVTREELAKMRELLNVWVAAENDSSSRNKASAAILNLMAELGKLHEPATKTLFQQRIAAIPTILSATQLDKLRELQRIGNQPAPTSAPTSAPTTKPAPK